MLTKKNLAETEQMEAKTLTDRAYQLLRNDIIHGVLAPGSKLRIEQLKQSYQVGATPLREALYRLTADGFVAVQGQRGFRVADMSLEELEDITNLRVALSFANSPDSGESFAALPLGRILAWLCAGLVVYLAGVLDAAAASRQRARRAPPPLPESPTPDPNHVQ